MEAFVFKIFEGEVEAYREEVLALSKEDAVDMALDALREVRISRTGWTTATLVDDAGAILWEVAKPIPVKDEADTPD